VLKRASSSVAGRRLLQLAVDGALVALAYYSAFALRFDNGVPHRYRDLLGGTIFLVVLGKLLIFGAFGLYHKLWRFIDQKDFERVVQAVFVATLLVVGAFFLLPGETDPPRGVVALDFLLTLAFISAARFAVRMLLVERSVRRFPERGAREVLIVGGGSGASRSASSTTTRASRACASAG
jgi:FlaA1/EpsC-like NDP-sugar epimerase